jgi:hypothetical protein
MTELKKNKRPNCDEILEDKYCWALSYGELVNSNGSAINGITFSDDIFHKFFIKKMNKFCSNSIPSNHDLYIKVIPATVLKMGNSRIFSMVKDPRGMCYH